MPNDILYKTVSVAKFLKKINEVKSEHKKQRNSFLQHINKIV